MSEAQPEIPQAPQTPSFEIPKEPSEPDVVNLEDGNFVGSFHHYHLEGGQMVEHRKEISLPMPDTPLPPFQYMKPVVDDDPLNPAENWEDTERENYYPVAFVKDAYRGPNHWHREDDAIVCAVLINGEWETRYFPRQNIDPEIWNTAKEMLGVESDT